jgi:hypothetical protein
MNYSKSKVYKIYSNLGNKIYVGSTTKDYLSQRMTKHREDYNLFKNGKKDRTTNVYLIFDEYGIDNCKIELLEEKECQNKDEKNRLEGKYIRELECVNKIIPDRTKKEYKSQIITCDCGSSFLIDNRTNHNRSKKHLTFINNK